MSSEIHLNEGAVIEFANKGKFCLGVVTNVDEKSDKVKLINATGRDMILPAKQILHDLKYRLPTSMLISNIQNELNSLDIRANNPANQCDIEDIWQLIEGEYDEISLNDMLSLPFDAPTPVQRLALIRALREDKIYFKAISNETFSPRNPQTVQELLRQREIRAQKEKWREKFADEALVLLNQPEDLRTQTVEDHILAHSDVLDAWKIIENYAVLGSDCQDKVEAEALLETVLSRMNRGFQGTAHLRARAFLRETGFWTPQTNVAIIKYEIPVQFSEEIEHDAFNYYQNPQTDPNRLDLTELDIFSIDDPDTLDIDDALSIEKLSENRLRLGIHIAAPASRLPVGSPLETEARHRSTSIYLPELRIPMLPAILSENAFSLMPGEKRNAISFLITLDSEFNILEQKIVPSVVISKHRLSYDMAEHMIEEGEDDLSDEIRLVQEITEFSAANRRNHGAIDIDIPEFKLKWLPEESRYEFHPIDPSMMSRQLVSECMIMANALAAEFCSEHSIPALYRLQPPPNNMPDAQTLEAMPNDLIRAFAMRRCMMPAASSMTPGFHAGLGLDKYIQATSPLRRYADLLCHYQLESWFATQNPRFDAEEFNAILAETDLGLSKARSASHEAYQLATLKYLKQLGNQIIDAIILQYNTERGDIAQVALIETQVRANLSTKNRWPVGTLCRVRIENIRPEEGVIQLQFIEVIS